MKDKLKVKSKEKEQAENTKAEKNNTVNELTDEQVENAAAGVAFPDGYNVDANGKWVG